MGIFEKFKSGFKKSASAFTTGLRDIVVKKEIDDKTLDKIEDYLIQSDVGIVSASEIREIISQTKIDPNKDLTDEINNILKNYIISIMKPLENIEFFVIDEADLMLDLGFNKDIQDVLRFLPRKRQTLFFTATVNKKIKAKK